MPSGSLNVFDINLLKSPGLQGVAALPGDEPPDREDAIISRLQSRSGSRSPRAGVKEKQKSGTRWRLVLPLLILGAALYWWYQGEFARSGTGLPAVAQPVQTATPVPVAPARPVGTSATVLAGFLDRLPSGVLVDFLEAGAGMFIYRLGGEGLDAILPQLNANVLGYQYGDLVGPIADGGQAFWLGAVAYDSEDDREALRPVAADYERFFARLQTYVSQSGGAVVEMIPGTMTAGEYVIRGSLTDIEAHLAVMTQLVAGATYHRMSILRQAEPSTEDYLLRVVFKLTEEAAASLLSLSQGATGALN